MCHYVPEIEFYMIQYLLAVKLCLPELEPTSIYPKHFCKKIRIYRDRSGPILSQYVDLSVFKIKSLYNKLGKLMPQGRKIAKM